MTLDLGSADVARHLVGEQGNNASIAWLIDIVNVGARMTRADCAFVSWEAQHKEKRQQEYKQMAEEAIARSLSDFKMPSLDFQDLLPRTNQQPEDEPK